MGWRNDFSMNADALPVIRSLLCHSHVPMALKCFASLRRCHQPKFRLVIHDDGTLTDPDCELLAGARGDTVFVRRVEADGPVLAALEKYPACRRYRARHPLGMKLFDVPLLAGAGPVVYSDSDIYYLRPFTGFHRLWSVAQNGSVFTRDIGTEYAIRYFHLFGPRRIRLVSRLNSGIFVLDPAAVDLDFVESLLGRFDPEGLPGLVEQTCWAALAARMGPCQFVSPRQAGYPLLETGQTAGRAAIPAERVTLHFVTPLRDRLSWLENEENDKGEAPREPVDLETIPAHLLTAPEYAWRRLGKQLRYWKGKFA